MSTSELRWMTAQSYEKQWWENRAEGLDLEFYQAYAANLRHELEGFLCIDRDTSILEIGSGAAGILTFLNSNARYAIDPLESFYSTVPRFVEFRDPHIKYNATKAEELPFDDHMFDLVINDNVLDHCEDPGRVLREMRRVLKDEGVIYLRLVTYHSWGKLVRTILEKFQIDKGHPHTFTKKSLETAIHHAGLKVAKRESKGYFRNWRADLLSGTLKGLAKAVLFATRDKTLLILKRQDQDFRPAKIP